MREMNNKQQQPQQSYQQQTTPTHGNDISLFKILFLLYCEILFYYITIIFDKMYKLLIDLISHILVSLPLISGIGT